MFRSHMAFRTALCALCSCLLAGCGSCEEEPRPSQDMTSSGPDLAMDMTSTDLGDRPDQEVMPDMPEDMPALDADMVAPLAACQADGEEPDEPLRHTVGAWEVEVMSQSGAWRVNGPGGEFSAPGPCDGSVRVGRGMPRVQMAFGAWKIGFDTRLMMWRDVATSVPVFTPEGDNLKISWPLQGDNTTDTVSLVFSPRGDDLDVELETTWQDATAGGFAQSCGDDESFFGLGTQVTGMDLRGGIYPLWTQEQGIDKPDDGGIFPLQNVPEAAYAPMGVLHSSAGWSAIVKPDTYTELDLCGRDTSRITTTSYRQFPGWVFVSGATPRERLTSLTEYIGRITRPARWVFGPWNDTVGGPDRVNEVATVLRENDIPSSAIWAEDWIGGELTPNGYRLSYAWEWDPETYPGLPQQIDVLHAQGFAFLAYFNTFVVSTTRMWQEGIENDYLIKDDEGEVYELTDPGFRNASMIDLTNPEAVTWLGGYLRTAARDLAIDGWMADFTEWLPHDAILANGQTGWEAHNKFPLLWQQLNRDVLTEVHADEADPSNWVYWVRSGWASTQGGSGGITPTMWGGDQNTDWGFDDGMPSVIPIGVHVGMSGVPIFGSDIAGYSWIGQGDVLSTKELYFRWTQIGAFHPLMRTHQGAAKCLNWSFDRDPDTIAHYRRYASLHTLLLPYFEMLLGEAIESGWPITRHPYLVFPGARELWQDDHYVHFLGDRVLVAPIIEEGGTARQLNLPPDTLWWALLGGETGYERMERSGEVNAPVTEIPVFVRGGTILPLLGEVVDSFYGASVDGLTDLEDVQGHYRAALYPDAAGMLEEVVFGEEAVTISGEGWMVQDGTPDWSMATWRGQPLPVCGGATAIDCHESERVVLRVGAGGKLVLGQAEVTLSATDPDVRVELYYGADAFGSWRAPTPLEQGLDSMAPPVCENRKAE